MLFLYPETELVAMNLISCENFPQFLVITYDVS